MYYDYEKLTEDFGDEGKTVGKSYFGRKILAIEHGSGGILFQGAIHAREHVTAYLTAFMAKYNAERKILKNACFVPLVNPDGVSLCIDGLDGVEKKYRDFLLEANDGSQNFEKWKANGRAVDLNLNFDADWGKGKGNIRYPSSSGYVGEKPLSESETRTLVELFENKKYEITFSFHAKGEELYYGYDGVDYDPRLTTEISAVLEYPAKTTAGSAGGFKDWCVLKKKIPAYTIEFGKDNLSYANLYDDADALKEKCVNLMKLLADYE